MAMILVVDDDDDVRSFLADALALAGHEVHEASDGLEGLARVEALAPAVVLTDLQMPHLDGLGLLARIKQEHPTIEVVMLTAHGSVTGAVEAMRLGAFDYLEKPIASPKALRVTVDRALDRRAALNDHTLTPPRLTWGAPAMTEVERALTRVSPTHATVLLLGESGTGKEVAAHAVHLRSPRASGPFVAVNCAVLSEGLLASELFGHEQGAFTGADQRRHGKLELAHGGTFFLDEIAELDIALQAKLLRVLQERTFERVGGNTPIEVDVRFVAATNRDLKAEIAQGRFREDLYHRLAVFPVCLPPLSARPEDLLPLADTLLVGIRRRLGRTGLKLSDEARDLLQTLAFPGNVRELSNVLERAAILASADTIMPADLDPMGNASPAHAGLPVPDGTLEELERAAIEAALARFDGHRKQAAEHLGIGLRTLYDKLKRYDIR